MLVQHILTPVLQRFSLLVYVNRDLAHLDAGLCHRVFYAFGRLIAQFDAFSLDLRPRLFPRLRRHQQHCPGASQATRKYAADYLKEYGEEFDPTSAWTYDGLNLLVNAIKKGGEDRTKIREALLATQGYKGVLGTFNFSPYGDGLSSVSICEIQPGGQFKVAGGCRRSILAAALNDMNPRVGRRAAILEKRSAVDDRVAFAWFRG